MILARKLLTDLRQYDRRKQAWRQNAARHDHIDAIFARISPPTQEQKARLRGWCQNLAWRGMKAALWRPWYCSAAVQWVSIIDSLLSSINENREDLSYKKDLTVIAVVANYFPISLFRLLQRRLRTKGPPFESSAKHTQK